MMAALTHCPAGPETSDLGVLATDAVDDFQAEQILHGLEKTGTTEHLQAACWEVLTADCFPARLGAAYAAVQLLHRWPDVKQKYWEMLVPLAHGLSRAQVANWTSGHYYLAYTREDFERFTTLATVLPRDEDRRAIAVMLFTWRSYGEDEALVRLFMDEALRSKTPIVSVES